MKFWLTPMQWIGLSVSLLLIDGLSLYVFVFYPAIYQVEAATQDYRIEELRQLDAGLTLQPLTTPPPTFGPVTVVQP